MVLTSTKVTFNITDEVKRFASNFILAYGSKEINKIKKMLSNKLQ